MRVMLFLRRIHVHYVLHRTLLSEIYPSLGEEREVERERERESLKHTLKYTIVITPSNIVFYSYSVEYKM